MSNTARHDKIVSLVEWMLELHKISPRMPQDKERVAREIESTDRAIDRLVSPTGTAYELSHKGMIPHKGAMYGLSEDEIKIVEGD